MRFLLDENVDVRLRGYLASLGHDATHVAVDYSASITDTAVLGLARRERRVLVTNDKDFGELIVRRRRKHAGVILLRLTSTRIDHLSMRVRDVVTRHSADLRQFIVVSDATIRVRRYT